MRYSLSENSFSKQKLKGPLTDINILKHTIKIYFKYLNLGLKLLNGS